MNRKQHKIASGFDLCALLSISVFFLVLSVALSYLLPSVSPVYIALVSVLLYFLALFGYTVIRVKGARDMAGELDDRFATDLGAVFEATEHPLLLCDGDGRAVFENPAFLSASLRDKGMPGRPFHELFSPEKEGDDTFARFADGTLFRVVKTPFVHAGKPFILFHFYDCTALAKVSERYTAERTVIAYAIIDNLEEILQFVQDEYAVTAARVEGVLVDWMTSIGGLFRSYDRNKYLMVFDNAALEETLASHFDILDRIRSIRVGDGMPITVSIGVCRLREGSLSDREAAAQSALDLALQRGGDQAVFRDGDTTRFFGGKTKASYKRVNIRARVVAHELLALIGRAGNVLVMGHRFGDYDSFAATVAMARLVMMQDTKVNIVVNRRDSNLVPCFEKVQGLDGYKGLFVDAATGLDMAKSDTLLIVVDVNNPRHVESPELMEKASSIAVVDHHIKTVNFNDAVKLEYIEPSASSASELVTEIIEHSVGPKALRPEEADLLLTGILLDTKRFTRSTGTRTFAAAQFLRGVGANPGETFEFFKSSVTDLEKEARFYQNVLIYRRDIAIASYDGEDADATYRTVCAKVADGLLGVKGVHAAFSVLRLDTTIVISARSDGTINVQSIMEALSGGGHFDAAGTQLEEGTIESAMEKLRSVIDDYLDKNKGEET